MTQIRGQKKYKTDWEIPRLWLDHSKNLEVINWLSDTLRHEKISKALAWDYHHSAPFWKGFSFSTDIKEHTPSKSVHFCFVTGQGILLKRDQHNVFIKCDTGLQVPFCQ